LLTAQGFETREGRLSVSGYRPGTSRAIDLRTIDRHPLASVGTLALDLRCSWCPGLAPMPKLLGLYVLPPAGATRAISKG